MRLDVGRRIQAGTVWINQHGALNPSVPFGGTKRRIRPRVRHPGAQGGRRTEGDQSMIRHRRAAHAAADPRDGAPVLSLGGLAGWRERLRACACRIAGHKSTVTSSWSPEAVRASAPRSPRGSPPTARDCQSSGGGGGSPAGRRGAKDRCRAYRRRLRQCRRCERCGRRVAAGFTERIDTVVCNAGRPGFTAVSDTDDLEWAAPAREPHDGLRDGS